jgi:hypothetical protein
LKKFGEPTGVRTLDLLIKSQLLYQLSYRLSPKPTFYGAAFAPHLVGGAVFMPSPDTMQEAILIFSTGL